MINRYARAICALILLAAVTVLGVSLGSPTQTGYTAPVSAAGAAPVATPGAGTLSAATPTVTYTGGPHFVSNASAQSGELICNDVLPCDDFALTVIAPPGYENTHNVRVQVEWPNSVSDFDVYILNSGGQTIATAATSNDPEVAFFPVTAGTNIYTVRVVPFAVTGDSFTGTINFVAIPPPPPTPLPGGDPPALYRNHYGPPRTPGVLEAAEPTLGVNWLTGDVMYLALLKALRVSFDDCFSPPRATWTETNQTISMQETLDPILVTDHDTGRTFVHQLTLNGGLAEYTDNDGETYTQMDGGHANEGVDHQAIAPGPYAPGAPPHPLYPNAVYYCSQSVAAAFCARSDNGGVLFNPGVQIYTIADCGTTFGLHGHVKVAPDGTVYVPKPGCQDLVSGDIDQVVTVSTDNGMSWTVRRVPGTNGTSFSDPSVGIGADGTVYMGMQDDNPADGGSLALVSVSTDRGATWSTPYDAGAAFNIRNTVFPAVIAGDGDRAAFAFYGTTTGGDHQVESFTGEWHLYVAHTYDRGLTWVTTDVTPNDPVQRRNVCGSGACRNLLDFFDADVDEQGRVYVAYADGCVGPCASDPNPPDGSPGFRERVVAMARQSGGKRLFAQYDPANPTVEDPPEQCNQGTPTPTAVTTGTVVPPTTLPTQTPGGPTATTEPPTSTTVPSSTPTICPASFTDVPNDHTFYANIRCLACRGIISGYSDGTFKPGNDITRSQIAKMVSNSAGFDEDPGPQIYEDVDPTYTFYSWINRLSMRGHMGGYECGLVPEEPCNPPDNRPYFRPNASATRGQLAKIVANAAEVGGTPTGLYYTDVPEANPFYVWIMRLTNLGVMSGYPCGGEGEPCDDANRPYFRPFANVTRGQASKIVANTFYPGCQTP